MCTQYQKEIYSSKTLNLMVNFSGIGKDDMAKASDLKLEIYAYDKNTYDTVFSETLNINEVRSLYEHLDLFSIIKDDSVEKTGKFIETFDDSEKLKCIVDSLSKIELENLDAAIKQTTYKKSIGNLSHLLKLEETGDVVKELKNHNELEGYGAGQPEKIFQNWIEKNLWSLGVEYIKKHPARKIGIFTESDLIMESSDGFIDLIELKRPNTELFKYDKSHKSHYPSPNLSKVIGQCLVYLKELDVYKGILEKEYKVKVLKPRIRIIAGRTDRFNEEQYEAMRMLNSNLNHIQIISYDHLLSNGEQIISYYSSKIEKKNNQIIKKDDFSNFPWGCRRNRRQ